MKYIVSFCQSPRGAYSIFERQEYIHARYVKSSFLPVNQSNKIDSGKLYQALKCYLQEDTVALLVKPQFYKSDDVKTTFYQLENYLNCRIIFDFSDKKVFHIKNSNDWHVYTGVRELYSGYKDIKYCSKAVASLLFPQDENKFHRHYAMAESALIGLYGIDAVLNGKVITDIKISDAVLQIKNALHH